MNDRNGSTFHSPVLVGSLRHRRHGRAVRHMTPSAFVVRRSTDTTRLLIVVTADPEHQTMRRAVTAATGTPPVRHDLGRQTVHALGRVDRSEVLLAHVDSGPFAVRTISGLVAAVGPDCVVFSGLGYGFRGDDIAYPQRLGDILIATELRPIAHRRVISATGRDVVEIMRGDPVRPSPRWLTRWRAAAVTWNGTGVDEGPLLSESLLIDSAGYRALLGGIDPAIIGGETEGAGAMAAALPAPVNWVVVKSISDWGYDRDPRHRARAAHGVASFVVHALCTGALGPSGDGAPSA